MAAMKRILVPTDFSKFSDKALKQAIEMAKQNKAKIYREGRKARKMFCISGEGK